ncbi:MAG TPA: NAD(P)-dependent oxidoreductase [Phycisphaerae bacterium]|nr:NAD(P)-dependent oxidoreductase [Phycisphaerae bacterium]
MSKPKDPNALPEAIESVEQLEELLSRPPREVVELFGRLKGPLAIVGGGGKIGPSLVKMACRARDAAKADVEIIVVDLFPDPAVKDDLAAAGATAVACDLLDPEAVKALPGAADVIYMVGMKFGTSGNPSLTWAINAIPPAHVARRYADARIVAFSTGCVYALTPADSNGSVETDPLEPPGEYANACVARERILEFYALRNQTPLMNVRLNYAVEMRYGVLVDVAQDIAAGRPVDVTMGFFNVLWQGDVNAAFLRLLEHAACPPAAINLTGPEKLSIREVARQMGEVMGRKATFTGAEADTALLSDAGKALALLGRPSVPADTVIPWVARWIASGGETLGKPTHFQERDGKY